MTKRVGLLLALGAVLIGCAAVFQHHARKPERQQARADASRKTMLQQQARSAQEAALQKAVSARPNDAAARWALASYYLQTQQPDLAVPQMDAMERLHPTDPGAQAALALGWLTVQRGDRAQSLYQGLIRHFPRSDAGWHGLALSLYQQKRFYEAGLAATRATEIDPSNPENHFLRGSAILEYATQFPDMAQPSGFLKTASRELEIAAKAWPNNGDVFFRLELLGAVQGNHRLARANFQRALKLSPRPEVYSAMAVVYKTDSNVVEERKLVDEGLARFPNDAILHDLRGQLLQSSGAPGEAEQALAEYQKAAALQPDNAGIQEHAGIAFFRANRLTEAQAAFETETRLNPGHPFPYQQLALIYTRQGQPQRAAAASQAAMQCTAAIQNLQHLQGLSQAHPGDAPLHLKLAALYRKRGLISAARDEYLLALHLSPGSAQARQGLATLEASGPEKK